MAASDNKSYQTSIAIAFAVSMTCLALILRFLARKLNHIPLGADDHFMVVGGVFTIANALVFVWSNKYGNGRHITTINPSDLTLYWRNNYLSYQFYGVAITAIKISILLFYRRIFSTAQFRKWFHGVGCLIIAWLFANNLVFAFQCTPLQKAWKPDLPGKCINRLIAVRTIQFFNVVLDAVVLALPISGVLHLQLSTARKISVLAVFLLGGLSVINAIVRLAILFTRRLGDITYETTVISFTAVEPAVEVVSGCLPTMAPLLRLWPSGKGRSSSGGKGRSSSAFKAPSLSAINLITPDTSANGNERYSFQQSQHKLRRHDGSRITSKASAANRRNQSEDSDTIALQGITVRRDLEWTQTENKSASF